MGEFQNRKNSVQTNLICYKNQTIRIFYISFVAVLKLNIFYPISSHFANWANKYKDDAQGENFTEQYESKQSQWVKHSSNVITTFQILGSFWIQGQRISQFSDTNCKHPYSPVPSVLLDRSKELQICISFFFS